MSKSSPRNVKHAIVATDIVLFTWKESRLFVRLISIDKNHYLQNALGLPGGLILPHETAEDSVERHLKNKALVEPKKVYLEQLHTFSNISRDPRGRVVSIAYIALVPWKNLSLKERENTLEVSWHSVNIIKSLAYDHNEILNVARERLAAKARYSTILTQILSPEFTLTQLEHVFAAITNIPLDKRNFRKKVIKLELVKEIPHTQQNSRGRPAKLYTFTSKKVQFIDIL